VETLSGEIMLVDPAMKILIVQSPNLDHDQDVTVRNNIARITTAGVVTEYPIPAASCSPTGITAGPDGALWFTEYNGNHIGRITTAGAITEYPLPKPLSGPTYITAGPDGALWFTEPDNQVGRITTTGTVTEYPVTPPAALYSAGAGITTGPDGQLWYAVSNLSEIGEIVFTTANLTVSPATGVANARLTFSGSAFAPNENVEKGYHRVLLLNERS